MRIHFCKPLTTQQYAQCCTYADKTKPEDAITEPQHQQTCHGSAMQSGDEQKICKHCKHSC